MPKFRPDMGRVEKARDELLQISGLSDSERVRYYQGIIAQQGMKIAGLRLQMQQMARGYQRALRRIEQQYKADKIPRVTSNRLRVAKARSNGTVGVET